MTAINAFEYVVCGACVDVCPKSAITCKDVVIIDTFKCTNYGVCIDKYLSSCIFA